MGLTIFESKDGAFKKGDITKILALLQKKLHSDQRCEFGILEFDPRGENITVGKIIKTIQKKKNNISHHTDVFRRLGFGILVPPPFYTLPSIVHQGDAKGWTVRRTNLKNFKMAQWLAVYLNREYGYGLHFLQNMVQRKLILSPPEIIAKFWRIWCENDLDNILSFNSPYLEALYSGGNWQWTIIND